MTWNELEAAVAGCSACGLHEGRPRRVFGGGNREARVMVVCGVASPADESRGEPFIGLAGMLFRSLMRDAGFVSGDTYLATVLKCRPDVGKIPGKVEALACAGFLRAQVTLVRPRVVVCAGLASAKLLVPGEKRGIKVIRGDLLTAEADGFRFTAVPTWDPEDVLDAKSALKRRETTKDLMKAHRCAFPERYTKAEGEDIAVEQEENYDRAVADKLSRM